MSTYRLTEMDWNVVTLWPPHMVGPELEGVATSDEAFLTLWILSYHGTVTPMLVYGSELPSADMQRAALKLLGVPDGVEPVEAEPVPG